MSTRAVLEAEHLYRMVEQSLIPPTTVRELDPDTIHAATARLGDVVGNASERYQLDSMLTDAEMGRLPTPGEATTLRQYYFTNTAEGYDRLVGKGSRWAGRHPDGVLRRVLEPAWSEAVAVGALFAVDLLLVRDGVLWRQVPGRDGALFDQRLDPARRQDLMDAVPASSTPVDLDLTVFAVGAFARAGYLYGKRSYRAVAMSAGLVLGSLTRAAGAVGVRAGLVDQFVDHRLNVALANDGVDRGIVAVLRLQAQPPSEDRSAT